MNDGQTNRVDSRDPVKATGGIAPFGYRWQNGILVIDQKEAPVRKLIYELFLKHRRKKTVAGILNDAGYRTRNKALFSDTTISRLLSDTTAKGVRVVDGTEIKVDPIVPVELWDRVNNLLGNRKNRKPARQAVQLFSGLIYCACGGKMMVPSTSPKYVCTNCRHKIPTADLEEIFQSQLKEFKILEKNLHSYWHDLTSKEKRTVAEQICNKITVGKDKIGIEFGVTPHSFKTPSFEQQNETGNETPVGPILVHTVAEPLLSEAEAAKLLGISKMTLLRKRNAGIIGFFRVGFRVLYSKEKHLLPFLEQCDTRN